MGKRVILAVAGAGKTYHICHNINPDKKNLILAFTHENIYNITKELTKSFGSIPAKTTICTFHSFVYRLLIRPYEPTGNGYCSFYDSIEAILLWTYD